MKVVAALALLLVALGASAQKPTLRLDWVSSARLTAMIIDKGWTFGSAEQMCVAVGPDKKIQRFPPRKKDGKCHVEDVK